VILFFYERGVAMIYGIELLFIFFGFLAFIPMILLNQRFVKNANGIWGDYTVTYVLLGGLLISLGFIVFDIVVDDISSSSGFQGLRGFLAYMSFLIYLFNVVFSAIYVKKLRKW